MISVDLNLIAAQLEGLEETIISRLIDRAQFKANTSAYAPGKSGFSGANQESLFDLRLRHHEEMDARFGRFCVPEERPFTSGLPSPSRIVNLPPLPLSIENYDCVNLAGRIKTAYFHMLPLLCREGDDGQYGSGVEHDVYALQAIARRIHYGSLYVAESKFRSNHAEFCELIARGDAAGCTSLLTRPEVEKKIIARLEIKVRHLQAGVNRDIRAIIDAGVVTDFYREYVIPLTKQGQVLYLMNRKERSG